MSSSKAPLGAYITMDHVRRANRARGHHFFSVGAMAFFSSRIESGLIDGRYFVTSEAFDETSERRFTLREVEDDGAVETLGAFQEHATIEAALAAIEAAR